VLLAARAARAAAGGGGAALGGSSWASGSSEFEDRTGATARSEAVGGGVTTARRRELRDAERAADAARRRARRRLRARLVGVSCGAEATALATRLLAAYERSRAGTVLARRAKALGWRTGAMRRHEKEAKHRNAKARRSAAAGAAAAMSSSASVGTGAGGRHSAAGSGMEAGPGGGGGGVGGAAGAVAAASRLGYSESKRDERAADWEADAVTRVWMGGDRPGGLYPALEAEARLVQAGLGLAGSRAIRGAPGPFGVEGWHFARAVSVRPDEAELTEADIRARRRLRDLDWERAAGYHAAALSREELERTRRERRSLARDVGVMAERAADLEESLALFRRTADRLAAEVTELEAAATRLEEEGERALEGAEEAGEAARRACREGGGVIGAEELGDAIQSLLRAAGMVDEP